MTPLSAFSKSKALLDVLMKAEGRGFEPFILHDLRRTIVSHLGEYLETEEKVCEAILNHQKKGMKKVYQRQIYREQRRIALQKYANYVEKQAIET